MLIELHQMLAAREPQSSSWPIWRARPAAVAFLRKQVTDGPMPTPQRFLAGLLSKFHPILRRGGDPLRAELTALLH